MTYVQPFDDSDVGEQFLDVQSGEVVVSGTSNTDTITAVDLTKSILLFSVECSAANNDAEDNNIRGQITDATTLTFTRASGVSGSCTIRWFVLEGSSGSPIVVQRGQSDLDPEPANITLTAVDTGDSYPIITNSGAFTSLQDFTTSTAEITSTTNLQLVTGDGSAQSTNIVEWQVVENSRWTVELHTVTMSGASTSTSITAITLAETITSVSGRIDGGGASANGNDSARYSLTSTTNLETERGGTNDTWTFKAYIVSTGGDISVQRVSAQIDDTQSVDQVTITSVDTARTALKLGSPNDSWTTMDTGSTRSDRQCLKAQLNSATQVELQRIDTSNDALYELEILECN